MLEKHSKVELKSLRMGIVSRRLRVRTTAGVQFRVYLLEGIQCPGLWRTRDCRNQVNSIGLSLAQTVLVCLPKYGRKAPDKRSMSQIEVTNHRR